MDNRAIKEQILARIEAHDTILISRHIRPDGDAVGSTRGLQEILRASYPQKEVHIVSDDYSDYVAFLDDEHYVPDEQTLRGALLLVLDTAGTDRISNARWAEAGELIKIDHHISITPYGGLAWVEDWRSSVCEMITDFALSFPERLRLTREAAFCLYTGLVTDSGRFQHEARGETMRIGAALLDTGIDTERIYANLYMDELEVLRFKAYVYEHIERSENGVAYFYADRAMQQRFGLSFEDACNCVAYLSTIRGSLIYAAFIEEPDGKSIRVRMRSRFLTINALAERYGGGGHARAAGAHVGSAEEMLRMIGEADALLKEYKETHEGWL